MNLGTLFINLVTLVLVRFANPLANGSWATWLPLCQPQPSHIYCITWRAVSYETKAERIRFIVVCCNSQNITTMEVALFSGGEVKKIVIVELSRTLWSHTSNQLINCNQKHVLTVSSLSQLSSSSTIASLTHLAYCQSESEVIPFLLPGES